MRRSRRIRSNTGSSGGISTGIKAICTGIRFCDEIAINVRIAISEYLKQKICFCVTCFPIQANSFCAISSVTPEREIAIEKAPSIA